MSRASSDLVTLFDVDVTGATLPEPSWNIAPTQSVSLLVDAAPRGDDEGGPPVRRLASARWGLIPPGAPMPPADAPHAIRVEDAVHDVVVREAAAARRGIVPASGYYEWVETEGGSRAPFYVELPEGELMLFAAVYEWWRDPRQSPADPARWVLSTSILTRAASGPVAELHDRMPLLVGAELMEDWLDPYTEGDDDLLDGMSSESLQHADRLGFRPVSTAGMPE